MDGWTLYLSFAVCFAVGVALGILGVVWLAEITDDIDVF